MDAHARRLDEGDQGAPLVLNARGVEAEPPAGAVLQAGRDEARSFGRGDELDAARDGDARRLGEVRGDGEREVGQREDRAITAPMALRWQGRISKLQTARPGAASSTCAPHCSLANRSCEK